MNTTPPDDIDFLIGVNTPPTEPSKVSGQYHSVKGTIVEAVGDLTGSESWNKSGSDEHAAGEAEYKAAQSKAYTEGCNDRAAGRKDAIIGVVTGNKTLEVEGNARHDAGQAKQKLNRVV